MIKWSDVYKVVKTIVEGVDLSGVRPEDKYDIEKITDFVFTEIRKQEKEDEENDEVPSEADLFEALSVGNNEGEKESCSNCGCSKHIIVTKTKIECYCCNYVKIR